MSADTYPQSDRRFLAASIRLGAARLGQTWPNPAVGCLIVRDGIIVGAGATGQGGRPHGETEALHEAAERAAGATAYVSLEPCNHHGKTGPCTDALIAAGIARVVIALGDPDPRVSGAGAARLRAAGVGVSFEPDVDMRAQARHAHRGHITRMTQHRPHVTLKLALSADGAIGLPQSGQVAITSAQTNGLMHGLRARVDAIGIGAGTMRADAPRLDVRLPGLEQRSPMRVVFGGSTRPDGFVHMPGHDLAASLAALGQQGITALLLEGGAELANSALSLGLVDELILLQGAVQLGPRAIRPFSGDPFADIEAAGLPGWRTIRTQSLGLDRMMVLIRPA